MKLRSLFCQKRVFLRSFVGSEFPEAAKPQMWPKKHISLRSACFSGFNGKKNGSERKRVGNMGQRGFYHPDPCGASETL